LSLPILISNRLIKLVGNISKGFSYIFHFFAPNKRFIIPEYSKPIIHSKNTSTIPKTIWQTNYTNRVSLPIYLNYLFNRLMSLSYEYRYISTEARLTYIESTASEEVFSAFKMLVNGASQADVWRLLVLNNEGGVYLDIDAHLVWPLSKIIKSDDKEVFLLNKEHYTNYFIASKPNNPVLEETLRIIIDNINNKKN
jgi:mannosyltransferase OCH1-like enzyme